MIKLGKNYDIIETEKPAGFIETANDCIGLVAISGQTVECTIINTKNDATIPSGITDLALSVVSGTQVDLSWGTSGDGGSAITGYIIKRTLNGVEETIEASFGDATTTSYSDTLLSPGDEVTYVIAAINAEGQAPFSNVPPTVTTSDPLDNIITQILADIAQLFALVLGLQNQIDEKQDKPIIKHFTVTETETSFTIIDPEVTTNSVVSLSVNEIPSGLNENVLSECSPASVEEGKFTVQCAIDSLEAGSTFNYFVTNP